MPLRFLLLQLLFGEADSASLVLAGFVPVSGELPLGELGALSDFCLGEPAIQICGMAHQEQIS